MSEQVIRQDIIQLSFDTDYSGLNKANDALDDLKKSVVGDLDKGVKNLTGEMDDLKKSVTGVGKSDGIDKLKDDIKGTDSTTKKALSSIKDFAKKAKEMAKISLTKLKNGLSKVNTQLSGIARKAGGAALTGLKKIASVSFKGLLVGLGTAAVAIGKVASMASDLEETKNKVDVAFGKGTGDFSGSAKTVLDWSKNSTTAMGLAQQTALDTAALFGDMGTSMGLTKDKAADMSMALTQQAADLASFKNMSIDEVTTALNGVFTGETESLKRLGVVMTQTNLEQYALSKGMNKSLKEMSEAEKVQLRYSYVMEKTKNATGDYKRTGGGFANQLRTLTENFKQLGAVIGGLPMTKLAKGMKVINDDLAKVQEILSDGIQEGDTDKIMNIVNGLIDKGIKAISDNLPKILPKVLKVIETIAKGLVKALPKVAPVLAKGVVDLMIGLGKIIVNNKDELINAAKEVVLEVVKAIYTGFTGKDMKFDMLENLGKSIKKVLPIVGGLTAAIFAFTKVKSIVSVIAGLFGKSGGKGGKGGFFGKLVKELKSLAKVKTKVVLKGMANLGIIVGGFTALAAAIMAISPYMSKLTDIKSLVKTLAAISVLSFVASGLAKSANLVSKIPIKTTLKGLANMAIMLGGLTLLTAAFMLVAPHIAELSDVKSIVKVVTVIMTLGILGTALSVLAGITGMIPVMAVVKGLANMAIMLVGMTALTAAFMLVAPKVAKLTSSKAVLKVAAIMTVLGGLGTVLSVFAGIAGLIPIPVVLAGLANIGLVLGGLTALIVAYGALSEIKGFNEFIKKGGNTLASIFNVIGKCVGSIIGGVGVGLTNSLPKIGENLSSFAKSLKPMFTTFSGADATGIGNFFKSMGTFMLTMAGNEALSFFTGGTDFAKLGTDLNTLATNSKGFFKTVATLPEKGFSNAKLLFDCLAGLKSLPKEGGVVGWFTGSIDYTKLANGLGQLSSEKVTNFFNKVAEIKQGGFDTATKLFDCLAGMKSLPKEGGVAGWFTGNINYANIATGLGHLSRESVKKFFEMVSGFSKKTFDNTKMLFETLAGMKSLPKEGGFWQNLGDKITGEETQSALSAIASDLSNFGEKTESFFNQINKLNLTNLNGLWSSLEKSGSVTTNVSKIVDTNVKDIVNKISTLPKKMGDGLKKSSSSLSSSLVSIWKDAVKASAKPVNKLIDGANWILKEFGSNKSIASWVPYAKGTDGHRGGNALVNDGRGAELVQMPNGNTFIPKGKNIFIPNAPKGMKVLPAERTAQLMGKKSPTFRYANGTGTDIWNYIDNPSGLINSVSNDYVDYNGVTGIGKSIGKGMVTTIKGEMSGWAKKLYDEFGVLSLAAYNPSKGVEQWRSTVIRALKMEGLYSASNVARTLYQMQTESGGNPKAINLWDSNAKKGIPSKGLMQVIDPTFKAYARAGFNKNIYDPLSNILASVRYAVSRYGSLAKAYRGVGYANGGFANKPSIFGEDGLEAAIPLSRNKRKQGIGLWQRTGEMLGMSYTPESDSNAYTTNNVQQQNTYAPVFNLTISGASDERTLKRKVKQWIKEAMDETFEGIGRINDIDLQEV